ncbi:MAG: DUF4240 domain-containing protein [Capnocytophaga sp.]|nr:DUF4240 domain-containing protein [Capnocytophaga sp.]
MTVETFWQLIEKARSVAGTDDKAYAPALQKELETLSDDDLLSFQFIYEWYEITIIKQTGHLMWSALVLINGGYCTDTYGFAGYLITHGREVYEQTLINPDFLATLNPKKDKCNYREVRRLAQHIYMECTKTKIRAFQKIYFAVWSEEIQNEITQSLTINPEKRDRNWNMEELKEKFPQLAETLAKQGKR